MHPADLLERSALFHKAIETMQDPTSLFLLMPVRVYDQHKVEIGLRHCTRSWKYKKFASGGLVAWVSLPHIPGWHGQTEWSYRFRPGYQWINVHATLELLYKQAYTQLGAIEERLALQTRVDAYHGPRRTAMLRWADVADGEGRQICCADMSNDDLDYWSPLCDQLEAQYAN